MSCAPIASAEERGVIPQEELVNHPKHYTSHPSGVECIQITEHYNFCVGNAIKYLWRNGLKEDKGRPVVRKQIEDLKKSIWYIEREIYNLEKEEKDGKR